MTPYITDYYAHSLSHVDAGSHSQILFFLGEKTRTCQVVLLSPFLTVSVVTGLLFSMVLLLWSPCISPHYMHYYTAHIEMIKVW